MSQAKKCPECGAPILPDAPKGNCPACLVRLGADGLVPAGELETPVPAGEGTCAQAAVRSSGQGDRGSSTLGESALPTLFGGYELLGEIGRGGMGVVYRARQLTINRVVALKLLLHGRFADTAFVERFRLEAEAAAQLDHPNIVPIYEVGQHQGQPFYSMRLIEGQSLERATAECSMQHAEFKRSTVEWLRRSAALVATVAQAVHYAHEHGVLHRDIKPHNILLDAEGQPHLTDFGLAKLLDQESSLTASAAIIGSPAFMAPEQAAGKTQQVTTAADVYGLGAVLYTLLTGKAVFQANTPLETARLVIEQEPVRPRVHNPSLDRDLEIICLKCLQKEPAKRYASAQALAEDLACWLRAEPIQARPVSATERAWLWCRRQPLRASLIGALALSLALGLSGVLWAWNRAKAGELRARQNAYAADMNLTQAAIEKSDVAGALEALNRQRPSPGQKDLRGWEWRYFWQRCWEPGAKSAPPSPMVLPIPVYSGALSLAPDSKHFIVVDNRDGVASLWRILPLGQLEKLAFLGASNSTVRWSPDGRTLAVGDWSGIVRIWDYPTRRAITNLANPGTSVGTLKFHGGGRTLFGGLMFRDPTAPNSDGRLAKLWDTRTWAEIRLPPDFPSGRGRWAAVSADNRILAALDDQGTVVWWEMASGRRLRQFEHHFGHNDGYLAFSPVAPLLAGSTTDGVTTIWDVTTGRIVTTIRANFKAVHGVAFSPDGQRLLSGGKDPSDVVRLLDLGSQRHVATLAGPPDSYWFLEMSKDLNTIVAASRNKTALVWQAPSMGEIEAAERQGATH
ncbi:MAG: WD40 repeat domain-containing serine/threonine protein kinase [Verrucomicrobiia bacterium]